jgi:hypothetical protein
MTEQEIVGVDNALETVGLVYNKFPKKIEVKIPRAKFPGIYLCIPTDGKSFKLQVYCHQSSFAFIDKLNTRGYVMTNADLDKIFSLNEVKGIPTEEEIVEYLNQALEEVVTIGIVRATVAAPVDVE